MARKRKKNIPKVESKNKSYPRVPCQFRRNDGEKWMKGKLIEGWVNKDGSLNLIDDKTGAILPIMSDSIQVQVTGPRGGKSWVDYADKVS